jgi:hypothetical protein
MKAHKITRIRKKTAMDILLSSFICLATPLSAMIEAAGPCKNKSENKVKIVWKIVKKETGKQSTDIESPPLMINK